MLGDCDVVAAVGTATSFGGGILGKNSDRPSIEPQRLYIFPSTTNYRYDPAKDGVRIIQRTISVCNKPTFAFACTKPEWCWGAEMGCNEV